MTAYKYKAIDKKGKIQRGRIDSGTVQDAEQRLGKMDLDVIALNVEKHDSSLLRKKVSRKDIIDFTFHMEQLIKAGVPILDAISDLRDSYPANSQLKVVTAALAEDIQSGKNFSQALAVHPSIFGEVYVSTVRVGEQSGKLHQVLAELAEMLEWQDDLTTQAKKIMTYPIIALTVITGVITFLMTMVVPDLVTFIKSIGMEIPPLTQALIDTSDFLINYWYILIITIATVIALTIISHKKIPKVRRFFDKIFIIMPLFGAIVLKLKISRFTKYFALMYASGITVLETLEMCKSVVRNMVIEEAIELARTQISEGEGISSSFANVGIFPPFVIRMMSVGETGGGLDESLYNISHFYTKEAKAGIDKIEPMVIPLLTLVVAALLIWIVLAVIPPIFDIVSKLGTM